MPETTSKMNGLTITTTPDIGDLTPLLPLGDGYKPSINGDTVITITFPNQDPAYVNTITVQAEGPITVAVQTPNGEFIDLPREDTGSEISINEEVLAIRITVVTETAPGGAIKIISLDACFEGKQCFGAGAILM